MTDVLLRVGDTLRAHRPAGPPVLLGRIVLIRAIDDHLMVSPLPKNDKHGHRRNYFPRPRMLSLGMIQRELSCSEPKFSVVEFETPSHWLLTSEQMAADADADPGSSRHTRRRLDRWEERRRAAYERIRPFVEGRTIEDILMDPNFSGWPAKRSAALGLKGVSQVQRDLNVYIFGLGMPGALRPFYSRCGAPGKHKASRKKTGRPNIGRRRLGTEHEGLNCNQYARDAFVRGWAKYKKPGVSVRQAFIKTLEEWFAKSERWVEGERRCVIKPEALRYTENQFKYWAQQGAGALSSRQIERGETAAKRVYLRRQNKMAGSFATANGNAFIDSTSTDVTLVSAASRQTVLTAPWRTEVLGAGLDYIFGQHVTFDSPSNTTALLALLHAAEDKVGYCARFGIKIEPSDWYPMTFHRVHADNGEFKGDLVFQQIDQMETAAHYGAAYDAINKAPGESNHNATHKNVDHAMPGSTFGRRPTRGEPRAAETARLTYHEYMPELIRHVLNHNNVERVSHLLTLEMRNEGVEPTRRRILEWMIKKGYVSSAPRDLNALRVRCLPRLRGVIHADGVHIFDPWTAGDCLIKRLVYRSDWMVTAGVLEKASTRSRRIDVHLDPMNLREVWVNLDGLRPLQLVTHDPDMCEITLMDWLGISEDDKLKDFLAKTNKVKVAIEETARRKRTVASATAELRAEMTRDGKKTKTEINRDRRHKTAVESAAMTGKLPTAKRGMSKVGTAASPSRTAKSPTTTGLPMQRASSAMHSSLESLLDEIR